MAHRAGLLCVAVALCAAVMFPAAASADPFFWVSESFDHDTAMDSVGGTVIGEWGVFADYRTYGEIAEPRVIVGMPSGAPEFESTEGAWAGWNGAGREWIRDLTPGTLGTSLWQDRLPPSDSVALPVSLSRSVTNTTFATGQATQTMRLTVDAMVDATPSHGDTLELQVVRAWGGPADIDYDNIVNVTTPTGWSVAPWNSGTYLYNGNPTALTPGESFQFVLDVDVTRTGSTAAARYHKPGQELWLGTHEDQPPVTGTQATVNLGPNMDLTFTSRSGETTTFRGTVSRDALEVGMAVQDGPIGAATPDQFFLVRTRDRSISGNTLYEFGIEASGQNVIAARFTTPGREHTLEMAPDDDLFSFWYHTANEGELAAMTQGSYLVDLLGTDGVWRQFELILEDADYISDMPSLDQGQGFVTDDRTPTFSWGGSADPNATVSHCAVDHGRSEWETFTGPGGGSWTAPSNLDIGGGVLMLHYADVTDTVVGGASATTGWASGQEYYYNIVPEPTTLTLLALGAAGLLRRRRSARHGR